MQLIPTTAPDDPATADLVRELRAQHDRWLDEYGIDLKVTGFTAVAIDISDQLGAALIPFGIFVVGLSLMLLTIVFRSICGADQGRPRLPAVGRGRVRRRGRGVRVGLVRRGCCT